MHKYLYINIQFNGDKFTHILIQVYTLYNFSRYKNRCA